jgi:hypothetical protein
MYDLLLVRLGRRQNLILRFLIDTGNVSHRDFFDRCARNFERVDFDYIGRTIGSTAHFDKEEISIRVLVRCFSTRKLSQRRRVFIKSAILQWRGTFLFALAGSGDGKSGAKAPPPL